MKSGNLSRVGLLTLEPGEKHGKVRHANVVIGQEFLGHPFVFTKSQPGGA
jgi:hypothetical protein